MTDSSVDRAARDRLATLILELQAGFIDHVEFVRNAFLIRSKDPTVDRLTRSVAVDSMDVYKGDMPSRRLRRHLLLAVLLLRSNRHYEWRDFTMDGASCLFALATGGLYVFVWRSVYRRRLRAVEAWNAFGDWSVWPFYRKSDFEAEYAKSCPFTPWKAA